MKFTLQKFVTILLLIAAFTITSNKAKALGYYGSFSYTSSALKVTFTDATTPTFGFTKWKWFFGDGDSSSTQNPVHTYLQGGTFNIVMVVYDNIYNYWDTVKKSVTLGYMSFVSTSVTQNNTNLLAKGSSNNEILCIKVQMSSTGKTIPLSKLRLNTKGTTNVSDIANARIWYTGSSSSFATTTQYGSTITSPNGGIVFSGSTNLANGNNYFWLSYDIDSAATSLDSADAKVDSVVINGAKHTPTNANPSGYRIISDCNADYAYSKVGNTVTFTNKSTSNNPSSSSYLWLFGDGDSSTQQDPVHQYAAAGTYTVVLALSNSSASCWDSVSKSIKIDSCFASFNDSISGYGVDFTNTSSSANSATATYMWDFGDSSAYDSSLNARHTYTQNGTYNVCLTMWDNGCSDTYCKQITIYVAPHCKANFTDSTVTGTYDTYFTDMSTSAASSLSYAWDFGDGNSSTQQNPMHSYSTSGQYNVCLTISDAANNCNNKYCASITLSSTAPACRASYSYKTNKKVVDFSDLCSGTKSYTTYLWDFGDSSTAATHSPSHTYAANGIYQVCLYIHDSDCSDSICKSIIVNDHFTISGTIYIGNSNTTADYGKVWAIHFDSSSSSLAAFDSTQLDSAGNYTLVVPPGYYLVKAALESTSSNYSDYLPTYYNDKLHWDTANLITVTTDVTGIDIHLITGTNPGGPGFIEGYTSQGANKTGAVGDPIAGVEIVLYNDQNKPIAYTVSDNKGYFSFSNLKYGNYFIHPEILGKMSTPLAVTLSSANPVQKSVVVEVNKYYVNVTLNTAIASPTFSLIYNIYPNPASYILNVILDENVKNNYTIQICDIQGRSTNVYAIKEGNKAQLNVASLPAGIYILTLQTKEGNIYRQRFTKE